jgi:hypothetical protein
MGVGAGRTLYVSLLAGASILIAVWSVGTLRGISLGKLTRDPAAINGVHPLVGTLSHLGVLMWCAAGAVCLFSAGLLKGPAWRESRRFLIATGCLSMALLTDDLFLVHELLSQRYLGLPESATYGVLAAATVAWLVRFRGVILAGEWLPLAAALILLALSMLADLVFQDLPRHAEWMYLVEDGAKFLGIAAWLGYCTRCASMSLTSAHPAPAGPVWITGRRHTR